jgi:hypothetical protein
MKAMVYVLLVLLAACAGKGSGDNVRNFIPGVYTRPINHEFSKGIDELTITHKSGNVYTIEKRSEIVRIRNGRALPAKYDTVLWTGIYHEEDQVIYEQQKGKVISFVPGENKLSVGGIDYRKANP